MAVSTVTKKKTRWESSDGVTCAMGQLCHWAMGQLGQLVNATMSFEMMI